MKHAITLCAAAMLLLVVHVSAQDQPAATKDQLRMPAAGKPETQTWKGREIIRNGDFDVGNAAWAMNGGTVGVSTDSGRSGKEEDFGAAIHVTTVLSANGLLAQMLHLPDKLTGGTLRMDWRLVSKGTPTLQGLSIAIGSFTEQAQFESAATIKEVNANNFPGWEWQKIEHTLSADELKAINTMHGKKRQLLLIASIVGDAVQLDVDNAGLKVDGEFTPPAAPGCIAFGETSRIKGPDGGRDRFEVNVCRADGGGKETMFRRDESSVECYGLAWRNDGKELCFSSTHEMAWSYFSGNLYALDDTGVRRVTNPPSQDEVLKDERKTGKVKLKVRNYTFGNVQGAIYIEGARKLGMFSLGPMDGGADETEVLIEDVVDYGLSVLQYVVVRVGGKSALTGVLVDVKAGETVEAEAVAKVDSTLLYINASSPSYSKDGKSITFSRGSFFKVNSEGGVPSGDVYGSIIGSDSALSPADDTLVYVAFNGGIWSLAPGAEQAEEIVSGDSLTFAEDPVWYPDASGLVFTAMTTNEAGWGGRNLAAYIKQNKQVIQLTDLFHEDLGDPTISPDGKWVAAIRQMRGNGNSVNELWVFKVGEPQTCWKIDTDGTPCHPAWCPR
ncbi:MAG: PD40 domain-containing protein [Planctomycetes bacterium]|nr:PD40 domain-containing protein [Planctomycetota bacterium]